MEWVKELPAAITVCDAEGVILSLNDRACATFEADGGAALVGTNVLACHPEPARTLLATMLREQKTHVYTIEKQGARKLIFQSPWYENGTYRGFVEISIPLPAEMPHFVRG